MNAVGKKLENTYKQENKFRKTHRLLDAVGGGGLTSATNTNFGEKGQSFQGKVRGLME